MKFDTSFPEHTIVCMPGIYQRLVLAFYKLFLFVHCLQILHQLYFQVTLFPRISEIIDLVSLPYNF